MKLHLRTFIISLLLLTAENATNEAWGKITYHILSLPMTTHQRDGVRNIEGENVTVFRENVRVEVLRVVSSDLHVNLPFQYRSPLATNYRYYTASAIAQTGPNQLYGYNNTRYYFYNIKDNTNANTTNNVDYGDSGSKVGGDDTNKDDNVPLAAAVEAGLRLTPGASCDDNIHIYVTYDNNSAAEGFDLGVDLLSPNSGNHKEYNIHLKDRMLVLNQKRQNRPGAVLDGKYTPEQLASKDFSWITSAGINNGDGWRHFGFKFGGNDPYNVTIFTSYDQPTTYRETGQANFFTTDKKDADKYYQKNVFKEYRGASFFSLMSAEIQSNMWISSEAHTQWLDGGSRDNAIAKSVPGYFKGPNDSKSTFYEMSPIFNSFAILNHISNEGWCLAGSKMNHGTTVWQPKESNGQIQYLDYKDNGNTITLVYKSEPSVAKVDVYEVKEYVFRVKTQFGNNVDAIMQWSDYYKDDAITTDMVPTELKRKYTEFTGNFYSDAALTSAVTTFENAQNTCSTDASGRPIIYVQYEVLGAPFTAITAANKTTGYTSATWYEMTDAASSDKKITWDVTNSVYKNSGGATVYNKESEFTFIGDPYELRIINRALTTNNSANRYVGSSARTTGSDLTNSDSDEGDGFKWEIPYDETVGSFTLKEFGSTDAYWNWNATTSDNNIQYSTSASTRIKTMEIGKVNYTFRVVDLSGRVAIEATASLTPFTTLTGYANIPAAIRSPFLADETVTFYDSYTDRNNDGVIDRRDWHTPTEQTALTELPVGANPVIYVSYTTSHLETKNIRLLFTQEFNVNLNGEYIYWDINTHKILSKKTPTTEELESNAFLWHLRGRDPYAMRIDSKGSSINAFGSPLPTMSATFYSTSGNGTSSTEDVNQGMFIRVEDDTWGDDKALTFVERNLASRFIAMMSNNVGVYEVLAATGDANYYHIGRASTAGAETRVYSDATYPHGSDQLRFELAGTDLTIYHLIDMQGNELFENEISSKNPRMTIPSEYMSPLVEEYYYYPNREKAMSNLPEDRISEIAQDTHENGIDAADGIIWVRYKTSDFGFGTSHPYILKFLQPYADGYYLEDGSDKLIKTPLQAVYPYCNGDGNLNIYGQKMNDEQMNGGSSTRPRWIWYFDCGTYANGTKKPNDPYHVMVHSKSTITFNGKSNTTYFRTYAVHFNQDDDPDQQHVVTGAHFPGITSVDATEYMILGTTGRYKLVTTNKIAADLDGDGYTNGAGENERRTVTSFEQYWKTYNMIKQYVLGIDCKKDVQYKDSFSTVQSTWVVPTELRDTLKTKLEALGIDGDDWHSYNAVANGLRWNGYSNVASGKGKKFVEELEHWFQTFDMGDGTFDIESADIPAVLVLLDRHGWEIMRKPLPTGSDDPDKEAKVAALKAFDSPMVKEYIFWSKATKGSDCHKYYSLSNAITESATSSTQYKSTSLGVLPPLTAKNVMSSGALNDQYVTYTVKEEYENSYTYNYDESTGKETGIASKFLFLQGGDYAQDNNTATINGVSVPGTGLSAMIINPDNNADSDGDHVIDDKNLWYVQPNLDIDDEMGIPWAATTGNGGEPKTKAETKKAYKDKTGFDPYNIQLKNAATGKFVTTHMTQSVLSGGAYTGVYSGEGGSLNVTLADSCILANAVLSPESYDHSTLKMTNQTFMAVQDGNGNMQLMPRFDNEHRINAFTTLATPLTAPENDHSGAQSTQLLRPLVFDYKVIDNDGNTALHYKAGGEFYPEMPEHFKSPLAKDFRFYYGIAKGTPAASTEGAWENAEFTYKKTADNEAGMTTQIEALIVPGEYVFKIGSSAPYTYKSVSVGTEITGAFAAAGIQESSDIFIRYAYDEDYDIDHENILQGRWMTIKLGDNRDVQADGTVIASLDNETIKGTGVSLYGGTKPSTASELYEAKQWQWKFLTSPSVSTSTYYYAPDPYAVQIFNREANHDTPMAYPNKMGTGIKVDGHDRFVLLEHPDGDYALLAAGNGLTYSFLNGEQMTPLIAGTPVAASVQLDDGFSTSSNGIDEHERVQFINDVPATEYTYKVITNDSILAASENQDYSTALSRFFEPMLPEGIQTPLLNQDDYLYYGTASVSDGKYTVDPESKLQTLFGLYDDVVYVRYKAYDELKSPYKVPNAKGTSGGHVARGSNSNDAALGINANLLYNIIWYNDDMMKSNAGGTGIESTADQALQAVDEYEWQLEGNDPYAIKIRSIGATSGNTKKYIHQATENTTELSTDATTFMILNRDGHDYGVLAKTGTPVVGGNALMLSDYGNTLTTSDPNNFIIFALATYKVIYHLMIKPTGEPVIIPYKGPLTNDVLNPSYNILTGSTQRDLTSGEPAGSTYQLGTNIYSIVPEPEEGTRVIGDSLYCVDAGCITLGDVLKVPDELYRPNVVYKYFIEGVYNSAGTAVVADMNTKYRGTERTQMGHDAGLLGTTVLINILYTFNGDLETNQGEGFVTGIDQNKWYTFETSGTTPYLAHYTNAWGLQSMEGRTTRYTNDYLWTPVGDAYGFKMHNRYMCVNSAKPNYVMTTVDLNSGTRLKMGEPGVDGIPAGNEIYELLTSSVNGYFNVHPIYNTDYTLFVKKGTDDYAELSTTPTPWTFGLSEELFTPYYERAGYVGALTTTPETGGKALYEEAAKETNPARRLMALQSVVYDDANIVPYTPGYYRMHSQPGVSGINPVRYASGYIHKSELTAGAGSTAIPMHFYSKKGVSTTFEDETDNNSLKTGFTRTVATRKSIPVPATEYDASTIFYIPGTTTLDGNPRSTLSTQGLYVKGAVNMVGEIEDNDHGDAVMTATAGEATTFSLMDIGAGVFLIHDGRVPANRTYFNFSQSYEKSSVNMVYDLKYFHNSPTDDAKWCLEPANIQGLMVNTNSGGDGYYYTTFYAPFDVQLPDDKGTATYYAYVCNEWNTDVIHPVKVPASGTMLEGKFVPANTPVIIRTNDNAGNIKLTLPNSSPTSAISSCVFSGQYLEQLLETEITTSDKVFSFGLPITGYGLTTESGADNGKITNYINRQQADTGVGFYINANPNKELSEESGLWNPNNRYVLANRAYYRGAGGGGGGAKAAQFVPVNFDFEDEPIVENDPEEGAMTSTGSTVKTELQGVYDAMGRKIVSAEEMSDNQWRQRLSPGLYIVNGRKVSLK